MFNHQGTLRIICALCIAVAVASGASGAAKQPTIRLEEVYPKGMDPLVGDWVGQFTSVETKNPKIAAQIYALGDGMYQINIVPELFMRCPPFAKMEVERIGGKLVFDAAGYKGTVSGNTFVGSRDEKNAPFEMTKYTHVSPTLGAKPPRGAIVLFDGKNFDKWQDATDWRVLDNGVAMVTPTAKLLASKDTFKDLELHVEFRLPNMPKARGQARGNSGVFVQDVYEVQVLDSYGLEGYYNECGALYKVSAPYVNACAPPLHWQTYDITFRAARFDSAGKLLENPRMTVLHNGIAIQNNQEISFLTTHSAAIRSKPHPKEPGRVTLQSHKNYVQFRNIWVVDMGK